MLEAGILTEIRRDHERRGYLRSTIYKRHLQIAGWARWLGARSCWTATADDVNCFLDTKRLCARSRYTWLAGLHVFYQWAIENGYTATDPTERIVRPRLRRFSPNWVSSLVSQHMQAVGVRATAHQLRHWFGTELYRGTHDLRVVQEMLGHSTPQTTAIYTAFDHRTARAGIAALAIEGPDAA